MEQLAAAAAAAAAAITVEVVVQLGALATGSPSGLVDTCRVIVTEGLVNPSDDEEDVELFELFCLVYNELSAVQLSLRSSRLFLDRVSGPLPVAVHPLLG